MLNQTTWRRGSEVCPLVVCYILRGWLVVYFLGQGLFHVLDIPSTYELYTCAKVPMHENDSFGQHIT